MRVHQRRHVKPSGSAPRKAQASAPATKVQENDQRHNGYKNYETWLMAMEVEGNYSGQGTYEFWREEAQAILEEHSDEKDSMCNACKPRFSHQRSLRK